jgi:hypothetical protein
LGNRNHAHAVRRASRRAERRCWVRLLGVRAVGVCHSVIRSHPGSSSRDVGQDLDGEALHLLGLIEDGVEQDHLGAGGSHLAQP